MKQTSFSDAKFASQKRLMRRGRSLVEIETATTGLSLVAALVPYFLNGDGAGRPTMGLARIEWNLGTRLPLRRAKEKLMNTESSARAKVEHRFHFVKRLFRHHDARYRGLTKKKSRLFTLFGFVNLVLARTSCGTPYFPVAS